MYEAYKGTRKEMPDELREQMPRIKEILRGKGSTSMAIIQIQDVSKKFQTKDGEIDALKHVTLDIEAGDIYGIIGMSGAGKSTLVRCINHIEVPTEGMVIVQDKDLSKLSEKELRKQREHIGMIFQHFNLLMQKSVLENVCFPLYIQGKKKAEARKRAAELLEIVGLSSFQIHVRGLKELVDYLSDLIFLSTC